MTSTSAAGPPAAGAPTSTDPAALLQHQKSAECELAAALALFQSEVTPAAEMSLPAVVEAARGAFRLGFAYTSCRCLDDNGQPLLEVTVLHRGGDQLSSQVRLSAEQAEEEFNQAARLLAQLLGIPVLSVTEQAQPSKAEQERVGIVAPAAVADARTTPATEVASEPATEGAALASPSPSGAPAPAASAPAAASEAPSAGPSGPGCPAAPGTVESLRPLQEGERQVLLEMIRSLRPVEARRQFQIAFRRHFKVPKQERTIAGFITQQRHKDFIDRFERELADLPTTTSSSADVDAEGGA
jgi:hypothetical protein